MLRLINNVIFEFDSRRSPAQNLAFPACSPSSSTRSSIPDVSDVLKRNSPGVPPKWTKPAGTSLAPGETATPAVQARQGLGGGPWKEVPATRTTITRVATKRSTTTTETAGEREDRVQADLEVLEVEGQAMEQVVQEEEVVVPKGQKEEVRN